ncbi:type IV secretion system protein [Pantoea sp. BAV 3049]|uniref:type IV secretion system protein n=1 Tax=Pantoea sp. BAV 3049 TaxID=2654188 RepID=UPI00131A908C|nr:type IV secretion system protein [Pantoea sp. BAV 3049]
MNIVSTFVTHITTLVESGVASNAAKIAQAISPVFIVAIGVYVAIKIFQISFSPNSDLIMKEIIVTIVQLSAVSVFTYSAPYYSQYVIPFVMHSGQDISNALTGNSDTANSVDNLWQSLSSTMDSFITLRTDQLSWDDLGGYIGAYLIYLVGYGSGIILIYYSTIFLTVSTFMVGILLSVGILFICFSVFPTTRAMFTSWCGSCLNYILLNVFYTISFSFVIDLIKENAISDASNSSLFAVITLLLITAISVFLIEQIGTLCSSLTGGVGINGLTAAASGIGGKALGVAAKASGLRAFMGGFGSKMGNPARQAGRNMASRIQQMASRGQKIKGG